MCPSTQLAAFDRFELMTEAVRTPACGFGHFLIVDDISSMRRVISSVLKEQMRHLKISEAADGKTALQTLTSSINGGMPIDFVVTDWNMPNMDGITLLRTIREIPHLKHLPVLLVTAEATKDMILAAAHAGADGYIVKPFNAHTLKTKLDQIFAKRRQAN